MSRVVQRTLEKYAALSLLVSTLLPVLSTRLEIWTSRGVYKDFSRGVKVSEFADLITSEFVSEYPEETALNYDTGLKPTAKYRLFEPPATVELSLISFGLCEQSSDGERASRAFPGTARWT